MKIIYKAIADFQQSVPAITKESEAKVTSEKGVFKYKYGSLPHILEKIKPTLKATGLAFSQPIIVEDGYEYIHTVIIHLESGEFIESKIRLPEVEFKGMNVVQSKGAIITYLRRYSLMSILGLVTDDDDTDAQGDTAPEKKQLPWLNQNTEAWKKAVEYLSTGGTIQKIKEKYALSKVNEDKLLTESL